MKKVMFISSEGGHLQELRQLNFNSYDYSVVTEKTDSTKSLKNKYPGKVHYLSYGTRRTPFIYFFILLFNFFKSWHIFRKIKPDVVVSTGTHTAIPMCFIAKKLYKRKVIWIETYANRTTGTLAGNICYKHNLYNTFIVQWPEMLEVFPKAKYWGSIF